MFLFAELLVTALHDDDDGGGAASFLGGPSACALYRCGAVWSPALRARPLRAAWRLGAAAVLHGGWLHLLFNLWAQVHLCCRPF